MRIDLECPFSEKDEAKRLGARWDADKRVWYVLDPMQLTPFARWLPKYKPKKADKPRKKKRQDSAHFGVTISTAKKPCSCNVLPWKECDHSRSPDSQMQLAPGDVVAQN